MKLLFFFLIATIANAQDSTLQVLQDSVTSVSSMADSIRVDSVPKSSDTTGILPIKPIVAKPDSLVLTIPDALARLLEFNPEIMEAKLQWHAKQHTALGSWGDFEPKLVGRYNKQSSAPYGSVVSEIKEEYKLGVQGSLITGTQYDVGFNQTNYDHSLSKSELYLGATVKQPLLKGIWFGSLWANQKIARLDEVKSLHEYRTQLAQIIEKMFTAYWDYFYSLRVYASESQSVAVAQSILEDGYKRVEQGKQSKLDLSKAQAELAIRLSRRMDAMSSVRDSRNQLSLLLGDPNLLGVTAFTVEPKLTSLLSDSVFSISMMDSIPLVNSTYLAQWNELERLKVIKKSHIDQALPSLNLVGSYGIQSTNRSTEMAIQNFSDPGMRDQVISGGVEIEVPLAFNYKERQTVQSAEQSIRAAKVRLGMIGQQLNQNCQILQKRSTDLSQQALYEHTSVSYHQSELASEIQKLNAGKSNYRTIFDIEEKLREAEKKEIEVIRAYYLAKLKMEITSGQILIRYGLESHVAGTFVLRKDLE